MQKILLQQLVFKLQKELFENSIVTFGISLTQTAYFVLKEFKTMQYISEHMVLLVSKFQYFLQSSVTFVPGDDALLYFA